MITVKGETEEDELLHKDEKQNCRCINSLCKRREKEADFWNKPFSF